MRRRLAVLSTIVLGLLLTAGPALATESSGGSGGSGDDDLWTGLIYALFGGVILGVVAFVDSTTGRNALDDVEHDAAH